jgi:hypothetical protein
MLDTQGEATFIIIDAPLYGCAAPQATLDILGNMRRSQKAVSPLWIDRCVQHGNIVELKQYIIRVSPTAAPPMHKASEEKSIDLGVPYSHAALVIGDTATLSATIRQANDKNLIDLGQSTRQSSVASRDTETFERKRRLSQSEVHLADDVVRPSGMIQKAVDPRVRPRPSVERQASDSEISTRPPTSIPRPGPATYSADILNQKRQFPRASVDDRPDATTLNPARSSLGMKDNPYVVVTSSIDASPRGVNTGSHSGQSIKPPYSNAAAKPGPSPPNATLSDRPNTPPLPPLPPHPSTSSGGLTSHGPIQQSDHRLNADVHSTGPSPSAKVQVAPMWAQHLASAASSSFRPTLSVPQPQIPADDEDECDLSSLLSFEASAYTPSSDDDATPNALLDGHSFASRSPTISRSTTLKSRFKNARLYTIDQIPMRVLSPINKARLGELVDELDKWLKSRPTDTHRQFLSNLNVQVNDLQTIRGMTADFP